MSGVTSFVPGMLDEENLLYDETIVYYDPFFMDTYVLLNPSVPSNNFLEIAEFEGAAPILDELEIIIKTTLQLFMNKMRGQYSPSYI